MSAGAEATLHEEHLTIRVQAAGSGGYVVRLEIADGWKLFGPGSEDGLPVRILADGADVDGAVVPPGTLTGTVDIAVPAGVPDHAALKYQLCAGDLCRRPVTVELPLPR